MKLIPDMLGGRPTPRSASNRSNIRERDGREPLHNAFAAFRRVSRFRFREQTRLKQRDPGCSSLLAVGHQPEWFRLRRVITILRKIQLGAARPQYSDTAA